MSQLPAIPVPEKINPDRSSRAIRVLGIPFLALASMKNGKLHRSFQGLKNGDRKQLKTLQVPLATY